LLGFLDVIRTAVVALVALPTLLLGGSISPADAAGSGSFVPGTVGNIYALQVALADNGDAVAVWVDVANSSAPVVRAATRPAGHAWGRPQSLSHAANAGLPDLAIAPNGNAVVVWRANVGQHDVVQQAVRSLSGRFGRARTVAESDESVVGSFGPPRVAIDRNGRALAVWSGGTYGAPVVQLAAGSSRSGLGAARTLADGHSPDVAVDGRGNATVVWVDASGIEAAFGSRAGRFGAAQVLGSGVSPTVAVNARGDALVAWSSASYPQNVVAAFRHGVGRFSPSVAVGSAGDYAYVQPVVDARGVGIVVWESSDYDTSSLHAVSRLPNGGFSAPQTLTPDADGFGVAAGARGRAIVVWSRYAGDLAAQTAVWNGARGRFGPPRRLSRAGYNAIDPTVSVDARGRDLAVWARSQGAHFVLEARTTTSTTRTGTASSRPAWLAPTLLSGVGAHNENVAVDARGHATIVWATDAATDQGVVEAVSASPDGRFGSPQAISGRGVWVGPDVGVDSAGNATVLWASGSPPSVVVDAASRSSTGSFGAPRPLGPPWHYVNSVQVAVNARGDTVASWVASDGSTYSRQVAIRPAGGAFGQPEQVSAVEPYGINPSVALNDRGDVIAVWDTFFGQASAVQAAFRPAGGRFESPVTIAEAPGTAPGGRFLYISGARAAIDAHGDATAVWLDTGTMKASVRRVATGAWSPALTITAATDCCSLVPNVAVDAQGGAIAAWVAEGQIWTSTRPARSDEWSAAVRISRPGEHAWTIAPTIGVGTKGTVVVAWRGDQVIEAAVRSGRGSFGPVRDVSQAGVQILQAAELAVDGRGNAIAVWTSVRSVLPRYSRSAYLQAARYRR
jgi:hypothetical protein